MERNRNVTIHDAKWLNPKRLSELPSRSPPPPHPSPHPHAWAGEARHLVSPASPNLTSVRTAILERCCCNRLFQRERPNWLRQSTIVPQIRYRLKIVSGTVENGKMTLYCCCNSQQYKLQLSELLETCAACGTAQPLYRHSADHRSANSTLKARHGQVKGTLQQIVAIGTYSTSRSAGFSPYIRLYRSRK